MSVLVWLLAPLSYLLGSVPIGYLIGRAYGVDVMAAGSGNIGATNVGRVLGPKAGTAAFVLDVLKGLVPVVVARWLAPNQPVLHVVCGLAAVLGHACSVFLHGRGGKGVSTSLGLSLGLSWFAGLVGFGTWLVLVGFVGYVSLASIVGTVAATAVLLGSSAHWSYKLAFVLSTVVVIVRHRANVVRLWRGEEPRLGASRPAAGTAPTEAEAAASATEPPSAQ